MSLPKGLRPREKKKKQEVSKPLSQGRFISLLEVD
jgi:hypothetical protein